MFRKRAKRIRSHDKFTKEVEVFADVNYAVDPSKFILSRDFFVPENYGRCVPKIRFGNNGGEGRRELAVN
jgi:hypothetical protein